MLVTDPDEFLALYSDERYPAREAPVARAAFLVAPAGATLAAESAADNRYMDLAQSIDPARMAAQHAELARHLSADVPIVTFPGDPECPDGMFPNNVFATIPGTLVVGRMRHAVRRREAERQDIRAFFRDAMRYHTIDLSQRALTAELTGAMVIDRARGVGYCGLSERCDLAGARAMHEAFGLRLTFCFELAAGEYHANVVMALPGSRLAIVAADGFRDPAVPNAIARAFAPHVVWLDAAQKAAFAANAIALGAGRVWMSARGAAALDAEQQSVIARARFTLCDAELDEIEKAGGSLRCCVAEIF